MNKEDLTKAIKEAIVSAASSIFMYLLIGVLIGIVLLGIIGFSMNAYNDYQSNKECEEQNCVEAVLSVAQISSDDSSFVRCNYKYGQENHTEYTNFFDNYQDAFAFKILIEQRNITFVKFDCERR